MPFHHENTNPFDDAYISKYYSRYRPAYPNVLLQNIMSFLGLKNTPPYTLAVDVACGTGQGTRLLADHFPEVIGIDISPTQIAEAKAIEKLPNVTYQVGAGESLPLEANSVDLVTIGSAIHWLDDMTTFYSEVDRVLKPGGCLAVYSYRAENIQLYFQEKTEELTYVFRKMVFGIDDVRWDMVTENFPYYADDFRDLPLPYMDSKRFDGMKITDDVTVAELIGFVKSLSLFEKYTHSQSSEGEKFLQDIQERVMAILDVTTSPQHTILRRELPLFLCMARKSNTNTIIHNQRYSI